MKIQESQVATRLGRALVFTHDGAVCALGFHGQRTFLLRSLRRRFGAIELERARAAGPAGDALKAYFAGDLAALSSLKLELAGTPFQRRVWRALRNIPAGRTLSYAALARAVGSPRAVRAVARANATNPVCLAVPCHRVIGADGALRGYAGGIDRKRQLLEHERRHSRHAA